MKKMSFALPIFFRWTLLLALLFSVTHAECQLLNFKKRKPSKGVSPVASAQVKLNPGQYEWNPQLSPSGPLLVVVSIDDQIAYVYRNGIQIGRSTVSTGKVGKNTPTGVFSILEKNKVHESNIYKGSQMPNMQRLTWTGIALHAGNLPGYPASAGCVRLPLDFSELLFEETSLGGTVVITKQNSYPTISDSPTAVLLASNIDPTSTPIPDRKPFWNPKRSMKGPVALLISISSETIYVFRNGVLIGQAPLGIAKTESPIREGVFMVLEGAESTESPLAPGRAKKRWATLSLDNQGPIKVDPIAEMRSRFRIHPVISNEIYNILASGSLLVVTKGTSTNQTRSERGFVIANPTKKKGIRVFKGILDKL